MEADRSLEVELGREYRIRRERFRHADVEVELVLPASSEALIDEIEFERDERLPYWAELWPSALALAAEVLERGSLPGPVLELGAGVGLPSIAAASRGADVLATDYYEAALRFVEANVERNPHRGRVTTRLLDWREVPDDLPRFPTVLAADVLYERRYVEMMLEVTPRVLAPHGVLLLADPGRVFFNDFLEAAARRGWRVHGLADRQAVRSTIRLVEVCVPA